MVGGSCDFCGSPAAGSCSLCTRAYCSRHGAGGLCAACRDGLCGVCGFRLSLGYCQACGRLVCTSCSLQADNVRRLCLDCAGRGLRPVPDPAGLRGASRLALQIVSLRV